jgi:hypothetical protein
VKADFNMRCVGKHSEGREARRGVPEGEQAEDAADAAEGGDYLGNPVFGPIQKRRSSVKARSLECKSSSKDNIRSWREIQMLVAGGYGKMGAVAGAPEASCATTGAARSVTVQASRRREAASTLPARMERHFGRLPRGRGSVA